MDEEDRILLERSARAYECAGLTWRNGSQCFYYDDPETGRELWNPLDNDGQVFRLAVKLRIDISHAPDFVVAGSGTANSMRRENGDDRDATRRAVVRVAAAMAPAT